MIWSGPVPGSRRRRSPSRSFHRGDHEGNGLVRHCHFPVPRYLLSGGRAQSWEWITGARRPVSWRYDAVGKALWSKASGGTG